MSMIEDIKSKVEEFENYTKENLFKLIKVKNFSSSEEDVARLIVELCQEAGFDEVGIDGLGSVIARIGNGPKKLVFDAHIDTCVFGDVSKWTFDPLSGEEKEGIIQGRGASGQKGGAAAMITAGKILKELNYSGEYTIYFTFTVMKEECEGIGWKYLIEEEGFKPT